LALLLFRALVASLSGGKSCEFISQIRKMAFEKNGARADTGESLYGRGKRDSEAKGEYFHHSISYASRRSHVPRVGHMRFSIAKYPAFGACFLGKAPRDWGT
jgi:hypothetical protein